MRNAAQFEKSVLSSKIAGEKVSDSIHSLAVDALENMLEHGQRAYVDFLLANLPKGIKAVAVKAWFIKYGPFGVKDDELTYNKGKMKAIVDKLIQLEEARQNPFWTIESEKKVSQVVFELDKDFEAFIKREVKKLVLAKAAGKDTVADEIKLIRLAAAMDMEIVFPEVEVAANDDAEEVAA